jgi:hypothetical protein
VRRCGRSYWEVGLGISLAEATTTLLKGSPLSWPKFQDQKPGTICLESSAQRRLFAFLLKQPATKLASPDEGMFKGLIAAWNDSADPAADHPDAAGGAMSGVWRLAKLEASGFGGLTVFGGPIFEIWIEGESWCLEGQNGSGKTSFTNSILWALTGKRVREYDGLVDDEGDRAPVYSDVGAEIGRWPPLISYPEKVSDLRNEAQVWVRLTFHNGKGDTAIAYRETTSPREGAPLTVKQIDARLLAIPQLIETGLLMPARISRIGFGNKSQSLYEAVKLLTGLDQLSDIAEAARLITHRAQPFLKYAKQQGVEREENKFDENVANAQKKAQSAGLDISGLRMLGQKHIGDSLRTSSKEAAAMAGEHLATLKAQIAEGLDTTKATARTAIREAAAGARAILNQGVKGIPEFEAWVGLKLAKEDPGFKKLPEVTAAARADLNIALGWHKRQSNDHTLRLKALAAHYYVVPDNNENGVCPLCLAQLTSEQQVTLKAELAELKAHADAAERKLADVCATLEKRLGTVLTAELRKHRDQLGAMNPKNAYESAARSRFAQDEPFKSTLTGIARLTEEIVTQQMAALPAFDYATPIETNDRMPSVATEVLNAIEGSERLHALVEWWALHGQAFRNAWAALVQQKDNTGRFQPRTIAGQLEILELAIERAEPLDDLARSLSSAADAADAWDTIKKQQMLREAIAQSLEPLKELRLLVNAETAAAIAGLSLRIKEILNRIHLQERLDYEDTSLQKKAVHVEGSFEPGMRIEAALVANTSWLRAILWAFVLALREQTIDGLKENPFPLAVMDDPQATFDPRNKRKWAD